LQPKRSPHIPREQPGERVEPIELRDRGGSNVEPVMLAIPVPVLYH
jgi:hypothetical protein